MNRILVVDDLAENRYLLEVMLKAYGYEVTTANDGEEALASARRQPPDLVISDILMPVVDGFALCRQWRADPALRGIPFIFYTATYTDARDEQLAMDLGADRFVIKPQEPQVMVKIVREILSSGTKNVPVAVAPPLRADDVVTLREYNEVLVRKLEKKVSELEAAHETSVADNQQRRQVEEALRRSEERWRLIYETEPECVKVVSADGLLEAMNPAGLTMIDACSLDEVRGRSMLDLIVPQHRDAYLAMHQEVIGGQARRIEFEMTGLRGTHRWLETHSVPLQNADGTVSELGITRDITQQKQSEALVNGQKQVLELIASGKPLGESLTALLRVVEQQSPGMLCSILLLNADGIHLSHGAAPSLPPEYCRVIDGVAIGPNVGSCGTAAFRSEPVIVEDIATDPLWADFRVLALSFGLRACWSTPIFDAKRKVLGTFAMYYRQPARPNEWQRRLIDMATHTAAIAISKHREDEALHDAQVELRESQARLRLLVQSANIGLWDWNLLTNESYFSTEWKRLLGYSDPEIPHRFEEWEIRLHPDDRTRTLAAVSDFLSGRRPDYDVEFRLRHKDGSWRWILARADVIRDAAGKPVRMMGCHVDITDRKNVEEALRSSESRLRLFLEQMPAVVWATDRDLRFTSSTGAALKGLGQQPGQVVGLLLSEYFQSDDLDFPPIAAHVRALKGETVRFETEWVGRIFASHVEPLRDPLGDIVGILGLAYDITDRKRDNEELIDSRERLTILSRQLIEAQEAERRHIARELHDEIGQALTAIKLNLKALQQPKLTNQSSALVKDTIGVVDQTLQQVRNLALDLRPSMLDDIGLVAALRWCLDRQSQRAGFVPQFVADASVSGASPEINTACFRIVQESLTNIARHANARHVRVEIRQFERELELLVTDDGIGFDIPAARDRASRGASIGLLGMEERVQLLGGQIEIDSTPPQGTTIRVRFPLAGDTTPPSIQSAVTHPQS